MKKALLAVGALISVSVMAKTVILYDDGTQYTVENNEKVCVSDYSQLYRLKQWGSGDMELKVLPSLKRDHVWGQVAKAISVVLNGVKPMYRGPKG